MLKNTFCLKKKVLQKVRRVEVLPQTPSHMHTAPSTGPVVSIFTGANKKKKKIDKAKGWGGGQSQSEIFKIAGNGEACGIKGQ